MKAIFVIIVKLVLLIAIPKHNFHRVNGQTAVPSEHMDLMQEQYEQFMQSHFYVAEAGPPFSSVVEGVERQMLTLFAKSDAKRDDHFDFLYTGRLIDKINYEDRRYEHVAFRCLHQRELWIIPPPEFDLDNKTMVHAAHMLHQPKAIAHFEFSKHRKYELFYQKARFIPPNFQYL